MVYSYAVNPDEWELIDADGLSHRVRPRATMSTNNGDTARAAALAGSGVIWQPTFLIGEDLRAGRLIELLPDFRMPDIDVLAVYPSRRHLSAKVRAMVEFLAEAFNGVPSWDR
ncbi:LysR substrate-binding domain-containing protein [Aureimonas populi]|uniref:LysR substrate-binding domain-containing protein n=1 Tax=Aureimonas populi TaxID=1701758 RepID=UPI001FD7823C|nr:LysR substrate-binding domain-containing protein [Aureimonas populi]